MKHVYSIFALAAVVFASCNNEQPKGRDSDGFDYQDTSSNRPTNASPGPDTTGFRQDTTSANFSTEDSSFLAEALSGGIMEVKLGELAIKKSKQESTQELGKMMVQDHSKANEEIRMLLKQRNLTIKDSLTKEHKSKIKEFEGIKAAEFDKKYIREMQTDHRKDISKFEAHLNKTANSSLKDFVNRTLPVLKKHENHVATLVKEEN